MQAWGVALVVSVTQVAARASAVDRVLGVLVVAPPQVHSRVRLPPPPQCPFEPRCQPQAG